jgi:acetoin utilization protein AcuB
MAAKAVKKSSRKSLGQLVNGVSERRGPVRRRTRRLAGAAPSFEVGSYMTATPFTIGPDRSLAEAHALMRAHLVRHLPVVRGGKLVGIVSQRDLMLIESLPDVSAYVPVADALIKDVFVVAPGDPLGSVCATMAERKLGSAVVMDGDRIVGIFTVTDACRVLARLLGYTKGQR